MQTARGQKFRYLLGAIICAGLNNVILIAGDHLGFGYVGLSVVCFFVTGTFAYAFHSLFTFRRDLGIRAYLLYMAGLLLGLLVSIVVLHLLYSVIGLPMWLAAPILTVTMFLSDVMNNAATAAVMCPIALGAAASLGVNADAFLMAVAIGASCSFLTPIGHQNNTLILGPGGFRFGDYWQLGLPLELIALVVGVPVILWAFPL